MKFKITTIILSFWVSINNIVSQNVKNHATPETFISDLNAFGEEPKKFVFKNLTDHDLIIFDDGLHNALEPFEFYQDYMLTYPGTVDFIFLEVFGIQSQSNIDAFLNLSKLEINLLKPVFQDSFDGIGWRYQSYVDFFAFIWEYNKTISPNKPVRLIAVDYPIFWKGIQTTSDYNVFKQSLTSRDYFMYQTIVAFMEEFKKGLKGMFLTNTRHAYKGIKRKDGKFFWNCGTFFYQWHPKKTYSIRFYNVFLNISKVKSSEQVHSVQGIDRYEYDWSTPAGGAWDKAFKSYNKSVAIPLQENAFGSTSYMGNHMGRALPYQSMEDAYDGIIYLRSIEKSKLSGTTNFYLDDSFEEEVIRRLTIIHGPRLDQEMKKYGVLNAKEYIKKLFTHIPERLNGLYKN